MRRRPTIPDIIFKFHLILDEFKGFLVFGLFDVVELEFEHVDRVVAVDAPWKRPVNPGLRGQGSSKLRTRPT